MTALAGAGALARLALRRDRIILPLWLLLFAGMATMSGSATAELYPTVSSRVAAATAANATPSLVALYGRVYDPESLGALAMLKMAGTFAIVISVFSIFLVVRHTRAEEETGRLELVGAAVVGRYASLTAALTVVVGFNLVLGWLTALGLIGVGFPARGSLAFGAVWTSVGIAFAVVAAVAAQLTQNARAAIGISVAVLGAAYLLRAVGDAAGDTEPAWPTWISPVGWAQQIRPYAGDRWWLLALLGGFAAALIVAAYVLTARRDLGAGLLADRPGRATAAASLRGPLALAWRLHRGSLLAWSAGFAVLGMVFGNVASSIGDFFDTPAAKQMITALGGEQGIIDAFLAAELGLIGVVASAYGVQAAMRLRAEETALRAEPVLATGVGRVRWAASHTAMALLGVTLLLTTFGLAAGAAHAAQVSDAGQIGRVLGGAPVHLPAAWLLTGLVVALFGAAPRLVTAAWGALAVFLLLGELGPLLELDQWVMDLSPYAHAPKLPGAELTMTPLLWLTGIAAALIAAGMYAFRRRDVG